MKRLLIVLLALMAWSGGAGAGPPPAAKSEFLATKDAYFMMSDSAGVSYAFSCSLRAAVGIPLHARVTFENPANKKSPFVVDRTIAAGERIFEAGSPGFRRIKNAATYAIEVQLFRDEAKTNLLGKHVQKVYFEIPAKLAEVMKIDLR